MGLLWAAACPRALGEHSLSYLSRALHTVYLVDTIG